MPGVPVPGGAVPAPGIDPGAAPAALVPPAKPAERVVSPEDEALAKDYLKRIEAAKDRPATKAAFKTFARNRKLLRGRDPSDIDNADKKIRANLFFSNLAMMRPQIYAKDPEYSVQPSAGVGEAQLGAAKKFAETCEAVLASELVKGCKLKRRAKRLLTSTFATSVGWWKLIFQEDKRTDPIVMNQLKDTQDELMRLQSLRDQLDDPEALTDTELQMGRLQQTLAGLQSNSEVTVSRGLALDFVLSEDMLILDPSVRELGDYERASALAHRIWFTRAALRTRFGYEPKGSRMFTESNGPGADAGRSNTTVGGQLSDDDLFEVFEVWDQDSGRVLHVCTGEKGFLDEPSSPDWTGQRWYPFFLLMFNETDGDLYPLSDIELTEPLVVEYNEARDDLVKDRRDARPVTIIRKGGSLTPDDAKRLANRDGGIITVEGVGGQPLANDIQGISFGKIDPLNYNTQPARADIEQIMGGGDAARGTVMQAKTATEAEILSQGLRGRSAERQDIMEDLLTEVGVYGLQILLRKLTPEEVKSIAGSDAQWPQLQSLDDIFRMVTLDVRGGSTGKPDRLQDQDRWTKLLPVIEGTIEKVADLRTKGQAQLADALVELTRQTLRQFDERLDLDQFIPPASADNKPNPEALAVQVQQMKAQLEEQGAALKEAQDGQQKMVFTAATAIATSANPTVSAAAFQQTLAVVAGDAAQANQIQQGGAPQPGQMPPGLHPALAAAMHGQQPGAAPPQGMPPGDLPPVPQPGPTQSGPDQPQ